MTQEIIQMARDSGMELYGLGKNRERFVYHLEAFAKLVTERALADPMREVQRLGQEIEQEKALQALHDENERLGLYEDAYAEPESECNPQDLCAGCRCKYAHVQPEQEPVCDKDPQGCWNVRCQLGKKCKNTPPQRTEPICPDCKAEVLYECVACSSNNYPPKETT